MSHSRSGLLAAGNFIVDHVKLIDRYPEQDTLAFIRRQTVSNGGGPYNVLKNLAAMQAGFPLAAAGLVGEDDNGAWIIGDCASHGIDTAQLRSTAQAPTSFTDAMTVEGSGRRTFFHQVGANALFDADSLDFSGTRARILHLGYLMLLEQLDAFDQTGRTGASLVLERAKQAGLTTSVDLVSTDHPDYRAIACSALSHTDHLLLNEIEAGKILGRELDQHDIAGLCAAAEELLEHVGHAVVLHFEEGAVAAEKGKPVHVAGSLVLPEGFSQGATGAGDAFAAGYLYGLHEGWPLAERVELAICAAATSLTHPSPSQGLRPVKECLALGQAYPHRILRQPKAHGIA